MSLVYTQRWILDSYKGREERDGGGKGEGGQS